MQKQNSTSQTSVSINKGAITYSSPSNIALVKYWGKRPVQLPANPSISFTLKNCRTVTTLEFEKADSFSFDVYVDDVISPSFRPKIETFFELIESYLPFVKNYAFTIRTSNTFPHSSGIASSASGMSALALCLCKLEQQLHADLRDEEFLKKASFIARIGSGSACRSVDGPLMIWGANKTFEGSNNETAIAWNGCAEVFNDFQDTVLLVDKGQKQVSSTVGHGLMNNHPFAEKRFEQAHENLSKLRKVMEKGDLVDFRKIVESEALTLHAMMMTSDPYFMLFKPNTVEIIQKVGDYREQSGLNLVITLDAGANVHLLYPAQEKDAVMAFINDQLVGYCENGQYICDEVGSGPALLKESYA